MVQWFHMYGMSPEDVKTVLRSYRFVFPYVSVWPPQRGDLLLVGSPAPHYLDYGKLAAALDDPLGHAQLGSIGIDVPRELMLKFLAAGNLLSRFTAGAPLSTDDRPRIEFNAPRNLFADTTVDNLAALVENQKGRFVDLPLRGLVHQTPSGLRIPAIDLRIDVPESSAVEGPTLRSHPRITSRFAIVDRQGKGISEPSKQMTEECFFVHAVDGA